MATTFAQAQETIVPFPHKLTMTYETTGFDNPESVVIDHANKALYVSNVNGPGAEKDGNGYISKVSMDGKILKKEWVPGLDAPKGMAMHDGKLYIADIDTLVIVDIKKSEVIAKHKAEGATFLNDVTADTKTGDIYIANTFGKSQLYRFQKGKLSLFMEGKQLDSPNGVLIHGDKLLVGSWGNDLDPKTKESKNPGKLLSLDLTSKKITPLTKSLGNLDGLSFSQNGLFISDWISGKVYYRANKSGEVSQPLSFNKGTADLVFDKDTNTLIIPHMMDNKIMAYKLGE